MFYSKYLFVTKGRLSNIWIAAHFEKKLTKKVVEGTDVEQSVSDIINPVAPIALRLSGQLLVGVARIYSKQVVYLQEDASHALTKIKISFRPGKIDLAPEKDPRRREQQLTVMDQYVDEFEIADPELTWEQLQEGLEADMLDDSEHFGRNDSFQARVQDITLQDDDRLSLMGDSLDLDRESRPRSLLGDDDLLSLNGTLLLESEDGSDARSFADTTGGLAGNDTTGSITIDPRGLEAPDMQEDELIPREPPANDDTTGSLSVELPRADVDVEMEAPDMEVDELIPLEPPPNADEQRENDDNASVHSKMTEKSKDSDAAVSRASAGLPLENIDPNTGRRSSVSELPLDDLVPTEEVLEPDADEAEAPPKKRRRKAKTQKRDSSPELSAKFLKQRINLKKVDDISGSRPAMDWALVSRRRELLDGMCYTNEQRRQICQATTIQPEIEMRFERPSRAAQGCAPKLLALFARRMRKAYKRSAGDMLAARDDEESQDDRRKRARLDPAEDKEHPDNADEPEPEPQPEDVAPDQELPEPEMELPDMEPLDDVSRPSDYASTVGLVSAGGDTTVNITDVLDVPPSPAPSHPSVDHDLPPEEPDKADDIFLHSKLSEQERADAGWSDRTKKMYQFLSNKEGDVLSFNELTEGKKRRTTVGVFYELLVLKGANRVSLKQDEPYGDIEITKTGRFSQAAA